MFHTQLLGSIIDPLVAFVILIPETVKFRSDLDKAVVPWGARLVEQVLGRQRAINKLFILRCYSKKY